MNSQCKTTSTTNMATSWKLKDTPYWQTWWIICKTHIVDITSQFGEATLQTRSSITTRKGIISYQILNISYMHFNYFYVKPLCIFSYQSVCIISWSPSQPSFSEPSPSSGDYLLAYTSLIMRHSDIQLYSWTE